ncbi:MAG: hypothetical protein E6J88_07915, partial [Deltaproteobacteria bacterium]
MDALLVLWWKAAVVLAAGAAVSLVAWRASAATRHLIWTAALAGALLLPLASAVLPAVPIAALPALPAVVNSVHQPALAPVQVAAPSPAPGARLKTPPVNSVHFADAPVNAVHFALDWRRAAPLLWLAVALALLLRIAVGSLQLRSLARRARAVTDDASQRLLRETTAYLGLRRNLKFLESGDTEVPLTWGSLHPVVVLPLAASRWPDAQKRAVLVHELAHVQRYDAATQLVARVACAVHWLNPLAWAAAAAMRAERERACDDFVLGAGARPTDYATNLLDVARAVLRDDAPAPALAMARRSQLEGRLLAVLDPRR